MSGKSKRILSDQRVRVSWKPGTDMPLKITCKAPAEILEKKFKPGRIAVVKRLLKWLAEGAALYRRCAGLQLGWYRGLIPSLVDGILCVMKRF
jgi:hypothetical protein